MKNVLLLLLFLTFTSSSYSQDFSKKWNSNYQRYDYYNSNGYLIGYEQWNANYQRWDYTKVNTNSYGKRPYQVEQPVERGDINFDMQILLEKQRRYDTNIAKLKEVNDISIEYIKVSATKNGLSYVTAYNRYINEYWNKIARGNYDISSNSTLDSLIDYLTKGVGYVVCVELKDCTLYNN